MDDAEFQKLLNAEPPLVVLPDKAKSIFLLIGSLLFVAVSMWIIPQKDAPVGVCLLSILCFGAGAVIAIRRLLYPERSALVLTDREFTVRRFDGEKSYLWSDVSEFFLSDAIVSASMSKTNTSGEKTTWAGDSSLIQKTLAIFFPSFAFLAYRRPVVKFRTHVSSIHDPSKKVDIHASINTGLSERGGTLSDVYCISPGRLAQLMNHWRERALQTESPTADNNQPVVSSSPTDDQSAHPKTPEKW